MTLRDSWALALYGQLRQLTARPPYPVAEENDRSVRNIADKPVRSRTGTQVSDVRGDKKDENLQPWSQASGGVWAVHHG
jgi:hypothetical protein